MKHSPGYSVDGPGSHADSQVQSMCKGPVVGGAQSIPEPERLVCRVAESESEGLGEVKGCGGLAKERFQSSGEPCVFSRGEH